MTRLDVETLARLFRGVILKTISRAKLPTLEMLSLSAKVKKETGIDHWTGLEKIIFCRVLSELDPSKEGVFVGL